MKFVLEVIDLKEDCQRLQEHRMQKQLSKFRDIYNEYPRLLWYIAGGVGLLAVTGFLALHRRVEKDEESDLSSIAVQESI
jgi:hypothetical protein